MMFLFNLFFFTWMLCIVGMVIFGFFLIANRKFGETATQLRFRVGECGSMAWDFFFLFFAERKDGEQKGTKKEQENFIFF